MTKRKDFKPADASMDIDTDEWFEQLATREIERLPTATWNSALKLWQNLKSAHPSTRCRILFAAFRICGQRTEPAPSLLLTALDGELLSPRDRGETKRGRPASKRRIELCREMRAGAENGKPPSPRLLKQLSVELQVSKAPRARAADPEKVRRAARLYAQGHSFSKIAQELGVGKATAHDYQRRSEFQKEVNDEQERWDPNHHSRVHETENGYWYCDIKRSPKKD
jgi:Putative ATPase subunit of terminase (gpP-like)